MTRDDRDFDAFSHRLDAEWQRERLRQAMPAPLAASEEAALLEAIERADPLGAERDWLVRLRETFQTWPARLAFAGVACACLVIGVLLGRATIGDRMAKGGIPPRPIESPEYKPEARRALGIGAPVKPESEKKFQEAMAFHGTPEFAAKAVGPLREAVALDAANDEAQFWLGVVLLLGGKSSDAIPPLEEAVRLAPASVRYKQYLLFAYLQTGDANRALRLQSEILKRP